MMDTLSIYVEKRKRKHFTISFAKQNDQKYVSCGFRGVDILLYSRFIVSTFTDFYKRRTNIASVTFSEVSRVESIYKIIRTASRSIDSAYFRTNTQSTVPENRKRAILYS